MSLKTWKVHPLYTTIAEILEKKKSITDVELFDILKEVYKDIGFNNLNRTLMQMEVAGKIHVSALTKGKRLVELKKR
ncbi:MAG: hypothetical protein ACE5NN_01495 [Candidatus Bathyarchaeia archaeon]